MEVSPKPAMAAERVETNLRLAVEEDRNLALLPEHNHHGAGMLLTPVGEVEFMRLPWRHRVNNPQNVVDNNRRAIARHRSAVRIRADSPESQSLRQ